LGAIGLIDVRIFARRLADVRVRFRRPTSASCQNFTNSRIGATPRAATTHGNDEHLLARLAAGRA